MTITITAVNVIITAMTVTITTHATQVIVERALCPWCRITHV
jgi:hypothetical protein